MNLKLTCELASRWLSRSIDEELSPREESLLEQHLDGCPRCREERQRLFVDMDWIEENWTGVEEEVETLLRDRIGEGADPYSPLLPPTPEPRSGRARLLVSAAALALLLAGTLHWRAGGPEGASAPVALLEHSAPGVTIRTRDGETWRDGTGVVSVAEGERVSVPDGGDAYLSFADGSYARLGAGSVLRLRRLDGEVILELVEGRTAYEVAERAPGAPFVVRTPLAEVRVVGTRFGVVHAAERTRVSVAEGTVEVRRRPARGDAMPVRAGEWLLVTRDRIQFAPEAQPLTDARSAAESLPEGGRDGDGGAGSGGEAEPTGAPRGDGDEGERAPPGALDMPPGSGSGSGNRRPRG